MIFEKFMIFWEDLFEDVWNRGNFLLFFTTILSFVFVIPLIILDILLFPIEIVISIIKFKKGV